jgi:hypothetical protein
MISLKLYPSQWDILLRCQDRLGESLHKSSIEKDIKEMKEVFGAPIRYSRSYQGYYYEAPFDFGSEFIDEFSNYINFEGYERKIINRIHHIPTLRIGRESDSGSMVFPFSSMRNSINPNRGFSNAELDR